MQIKWQDAAMLIAIAFFIGFLISNNPPKPTSNNNGTINEKEIFRTRLDTVLSVVYVPFRPLTARAAPNNSKTITLHDTIYEEACLDTLFKTDTSAIAPDTLSICTADNLFSIALSLSPRRKEVAVPYIARDTFYSREDTVRVASGEPPRPWYEQALVVILSVAAGIVMGKL
jgi:hypothetical protein